MRDIPLVLSSVFFLHASIVCRALYNGSLIGRKTMYQNVLRLFRGFLSVAW